jgi:hypothetical protein
MAEEKKKWWQRLVVGDSDTAVNISDTPIVRDDQPPASWTDQYTVDDTGDTEGIDWGALLQRVGFEATGSAAAVRAMSPYLRQLQAGGGPGRAAAITGTALAGAFGGWAGREGDIRRGNVMPGDESWQGDALTLAGGTVVPVPSRVVGAATKWVGQKAMAEGAEEMTEQGLGWTPGQASEWALIKGLEQLLRELPLTGGVTNKRLTEIYGQFDDLVTRISDDGTINWGTDAEVVGGKIQASAKVKMEKYDERVQMLYDLLWNAESKTGLIPASTRVDLLATKKWLNNYGGSFDELGGDLQKILGIESIDSLRTALSKEEMISWQNADILRKAVGRNTRGQFVAGQHDPGAYKQLYGAILDDMGVAADQTSPLANKAFRNARRYWKAADAVGIKLEKEILSKDPDKLLNAIFAGNLTIIATAKKASDPEVWKGVQAAVAQRLGKVAPGQQGAAGDVFSPITFLTNYNRIRKTSSKPLELLFKGAGKYRGIDTELQKLAVIAERLKSTARFGNPSGTARTMQLIDMMKTGAVVLGSVASFATIGMPWEALAGIGGIYTTGRLWTNKAFLNWLVKGEKARPNTQAFGDWISAMPIYSTTEWMSSSDREFMTKLGETLLDWSDKWDIPMIPEASGSEPIQQALSQSGQPPKRRSQGAY